MDERWEWQFIGDDQWIFGLKVRGVVRVPVAEVYYDESTESGDGEGGWRWMARVSGLLPVRGVTVRRYDAFDCAERALQGE